MPIYSDAKKIMDSAIQAALPDTAVRDALKKLPEVKGKILLVSVGKAAWQMASVAQEILQDRLSSGIVITKYHHSRGPIPQLAIYEAGHPVPDENSFSATQAAIELVNELNKEDLVLFLLSGGGSALFEKPRIDAQELQDITKQLLACGADITEINTIRKRLSAVKGGRFAQLCAPASVFSVVLSDIIGDPLDMIASGPAYPDSATSQDAISIAQKYQLKMCPQTFDLMAEETPKYLDNVQTYVAGSVKQLCCAAEKTARELGYTPVVLTSMLCCEAREAGSFLASIAQHHHSSGQSLAFIAGGETVVHLTGTGKGGRNQELALAAAKGIAGLENTVVFSLGSDGTDGPTDASGGIVDGNTCYHLLDKGIVIDDVLANNDAYHALQSVDSLIITGPTGTNVNDLAVLLIRH